MVQGVSHDRQQTTVLPPPAALFGPSLFHPAPPQPQHSLPPSMSASSSEAGRPVFILPPPSSLPGFHLYQQPTSLHPPPPPQYTTNVSPPLSSAGTPVTATKTTTTQELSPVSPSSLKRTRSGGGVGETKRKQRRTTEKNSSMRTARHHEITPTQQKAEHDAVNAAAATLASFATLQDDGECHCRGELRCDHCDSSFAHAKCLSNHRWEHAEGWKEIQGKLGMSKTQQVQLLEAAQILMDIARCGMRVSVV
ncbi:hypothetical protein BCR43DRAFT_497260 [Syncephalastrum racemosum]|uniref:C2H2-type domain-containing protein n=1 Tax=Syncephalastrum racemosum TaxID=13706 RepID=A0A1X2H5D6_SYNRA|nr:hypothetical protein BCR43DRAFT_497260 [Syncephalastrum racemosum]